MKIRSIQFFAIIAVLSLLTITPGFLPAHATNNTISSTTVYNPVQIEGLNQTQSLGNDTVANVPDNPPDVSLAAGPNHLVEMVNSVVAFYTKPAGTLLRITALNTFFKVGASSFVFDPKILYDASSQRWFASAGDCQGNTGYTPCNAPSPTLVHVAISTSNDPTGTWNVYTVSPPSNFADQPILGISDNLVTISTNNFQGVSGPFIGAETWVFSKSQMISGNSNLSNQTFGPDTTRFSIHPVQSLSSTTTQYMVSALNAVVNTTGAPANKIELISLTGTPPNVAFSTTSFTVTNISPPPIGGQPCCVGGPNVNTDDARVTTASWQNNILWLALNDGCTPTGDTQGRSCIRLDRINTSTSALLQDFDFAVKGTDQYYPALQMDASGNLGLIYGFSNSTSYPSLALTGQLTTDPANSLAKPAILRTGALTETGGRYGDYFGAAVDPSDTAVIWTSGEYHANYNQAVTCQPGRCWFTAIGALTLSQPDFSITGPGSINCRALHPCSYVVTISSIHYFSGTVSLTFTACPSGATCTASPSSVTISAGGSATSTVSVSPSTGGTVTIKGTSGSLSHSLSTHITITT